MNFSSIEPNVIEIMNFWPGSGSVYATNHWIDIGVEFRKYGFADALSVDMMAYLDGTPHALTLIESEDWGQEEYWGFELHLEDAGTWTIEVDITNTNGPSTSGRIIIIVCSPSVLNELSISYPSIMIGGTLQVTVEVWDSNGIDSVNLWVHAFGYAIPKPMVQTGTVGTGEIFECDVFFDELGEFWIEIEVINKLGLSTEVGGEWIRVLDAPEIIDVEVSPSRYIESGTEITIEVEILKSDVTINDVSLTLKDSDMNSFAYVLSFSSETEESETYSVDFILTEESDYECEIKVTNTKGQFTTYSVSIIVESEEEETEATISPTFEYLMIFVSLMLFITYRKRLIK